MKTKYEILKSPLINLRFVIRKAILQTKSNYSYNSIYRFINLEGNVKHQNDHYDKIVDKAYEIVFEKLQEIENDYTKIKSRVFKINTVCKLSNNPDTHWHLYEILYGRTSKSPALDSILGKFFEHFEYKRKQKNGSNRY